MILMTYLEIVTTQEGEGHDWRVIDEYSDDTGIFGIGQ